MEEFRDLIAKLEKDWLTLMGSNAGRLLFHQDVSRFSRTYMRSFFALLKQADRLRLVCVNREEAQAWDRRVEDLQILLRQ